MEPINQESGIKSKRKVPRIVNQVYDEGES